MNRRCKMVASPDTKVFSPKGMTVEDFFSRSMGTWSTQRSSHSLAFQQFEAITSEVKITPLSASSESIQTLCAQNETSADAASVCLHMSWEGTSDWDENVLDGECCMCVVKDSERGGRLLRSIGYAETVPAVGVWEMSEDGVFILTTPYDRASAEERIWFATPNLRMRVSQIRTSSGAGVVTASFASELRQMSDES